MTKMANYGVTRLGSGAVLTTDVNPQSLNSKDLGKRKSSQVKRDSIQTFFNNRKRAVRIGKAPTLSDADQQLAIRKFLSEGKATRYPMGATGDKFFAEDKTCIELLKQAKAITDG